MTRYEIQAPGLNWRISDSFAIYSDEDALMFADHPDWNPYAGKFPESFRLVRIEEETPQEADKARLDWLANTDCCIQFVQRWRFSIAFENSTDTPKDFRAAIDHARGYAPTVTVIKEYPNEQ